ncbi:MAG: cyanophycin synthetase, partial [bacterium]
EPQQRPELEKTAPVHLELLGSLWNILEAKLELFAHLAPGSAWVYPAPDAFIRAGIANLPPVPHETIRFVPGMQMVEPGDPDLLLAEHLRWDDTGGGWEFDLRWREERCKTRLQTVALGQLWSALAAVAGALALGVPLAACAARLPATPAITGRMEVRHRFPKRTILFDCYNSNPISAADALTTLARLGQGHQTVAILGGMKELGPESERYHRELGAQARSLGIQQVLAIGDEAEWIADGAAGAATQVFTAASIGEATGWLGSQVSGDAVVLLKGSRAYHLEDALEAAW